MVGKLRNSSTWIYAGIGRAWMFPYDDPKYIYTMMHESVEGMFVIEDNSRFIVQEY